MAEYFIVDYANLEHGFIYLFANYFMAAGIPLLLGDLRFGKDRKKLLFLILQIVGCVVVLEFLASVYWAIFRSDTYVPFVCGAITLALYAAVFCRNKVAVRLIRSGAYCGLSSLALGTTMSIGQILGTPYHYLQWLLISVNGIMMFSAVFFVRYYSVGEETVCPPVYVAAITGAGVLCTLFPVVSLAFGIDPAASLVLSLLFIFLYLLMYFIISNMLKKAYEDACRQAEEIMRHSDKEVFRLSDESLENLRKLRHEMKNQYAYMKALLDGGDYDKLHRYFAEYSDKIEEMNGFTDYGNSTLNAIVNIEQSRARRANVELDCRIAVPEKLNILDVDLCSLLMNLINNAVEYLERTEGVARTVRVEITMRNQTLLITVKNPLLPGHEPQALRLETGKQKKELHGYGSKVVASVVGKYNGSVAYEAENGVFTASAMLSNPPDGGGA